MTTLLLTEVGGSARCGPVLASIACSSVANEQKEANVAVAMMVDNPEGSQEVYEQIRAHLGLDSPQAASSASPGLAPWGVGA